MGIYTKPSQEYHPYNVNTLELHPKRVYIFIFSIARKMAALFPVTETDLGKVGSQPSMYSIPSRSGAHQIQFPRRTGDSLSAMSPRHRLEGEIRHGQYYKSASFNQNSRILFHLLIATYPTIFSTSSFFNQTWPFRREGTPRLLYAVYRPQEWWDTLYNT